MKPKAANRKIELKFMDISIKLEGKRNIENKALNIMSMMLSDRMRMAEIMAELDHGEDEPGERKSKKQPIKADIEFMKCYA